MNLNIIIICVNIFKRTYWNICKRSKRENFPTHCNWMEFKRNPERHYYLTPSPPPPSSSPLLSHNSEKNQYSRNAEKLCTKFVKTNLLPIFNTSHVVACVRLSWPPTNLKTIILMQYLCSINLIRSPFFRSFFPFLYFIFSFFLLIRSLHFCATFPFAFFKSALQWKLEKVHEHWTQNEINKLLPPPRMTEWETKMETGKKKQMHHILQQWK